MNRLKEFAPVTLSLPQPERGPRTTDSLDAHVLAIIGPTAALEPAVPLDSLRLPGRVDDALLYFRHGHRLVGLKGFLMPRQDTGDLRFTVTDGVELPRRAATRITVSLPVRLRHPDAGDHRSGTTIDLSADGVLAEIDLEAAPGDRLLVSIDTVPGSEAVEATAHVVRRQSSLIAMQFAPEERAARGQLAQHVVEHNRRALRASHAAAQPLNF
jgi:PilZ domain-containing protein